MSFKELKTIEYALTHAGSFHADDVFSAAFLKIINPDILIKRVTNVTPGFNGLAFDIGDGKFDHHSADNECRENGMPYAAFGKLWREYAPDIYGDFVYKKMDKTFIEDLDLSDNTGSKNSLCMAIEALNPIDRSLNGDKEFDEAVVFAKSILENLIAKVKIYEKDSNDVLDIYEKSDNKQIIVLKEHKHFKDALPSTDAIYVIFPSKRGGYNAQGVTKTPDANELKKAFPSKWLEDKPEYIRFCHKSGFLIATDTLEDAITACKEALK